MLKKIKKIGSVIVFLLPSVKMKSRSPRQAVFAQELHDFLFSQFGGYTVASGNITGYWRTEKNQEECNELIGTYNSCPDYFGESSEPRGGDVDLLQTILQDAARRCELKKLLDADGITFEVERLEKFVDLVGLPNGVGAYEYLKSGERDGIKGWKQFVHIPDLTEEKNAARTAKTKAKNDMKQLITDGLLIVDMAGGKTTHSLCPSSPVWAIDGNSNEALLAWTGSPIGAASNVDLNRVNLQTGEINKTGIQLSSHLHCMAVSPNGTWLAVGCACGDWKTDIYDLKDGKLVEEIPQSRAVTEVCFNQASDTLFSLSENIISVINLPSGKVDARIELPGSSNTMLLHPGGKLLVAIYEGMIALVDVSSKKIVKSVWLQQPTGPMRDMMEHIKAKNLDQKFLGAMPGADSAEEQERRRRQMERHFLPKQSVHSLSIGSAGNALFCGGSDGVNVILWDKILAASDMEGMQSQAFIPAERIISEDSTSRNNLVYAMPIDSAKKRILFAGLEGKIKFVNIHDQRLGDLLSPPVKRPFWRLKLSPDRAVLVGTAIPTPWGRRDKPDPSCFQIWNYKSLCHAANLDW